LEKRSLFLFRPANHTSVAFRAFFGAPSLYLHQLDVYLLVLAFGAATLLKLPRICILHSYLVAGLRNARISCVLR
jgi:hypothetical protein